MCTMRAEKTLEKSIVRNGQRGERGRPRTEWVGDIKLWTHIRSVKSVEYWENGGEWLGESPEIRPDLQEQNKN